MPPKGKKNKKNNKHERSKSKSVDVRDKNNNNCQKEIKDQQDPLIECTPCIDITLEEENNMKNNDIEVECLISLNSMIDKVSLSSSIPNDNVSSMIEENLIHENITFDIEPPMIIQSNEEAHFEESIIKDTREKQKHFITNNLTSIKKISPQIYSELIIQPAVQYFLAILCDLKINDENKQRLGVRYAKTPEVQKLLCKLIKKKKITKKQEVDSADPNVIISVLKEILSQFPGGIFPDDDEEFISVTLSSSLDYALLYVNGLIASLPLFLRHFTYLICKSLNNLAKQSAGSLTDSYTDIVLLFTPVLFPTAIKDMSRFLRASRISLILIDLCDKVFKPLLELNDMNENDDDFFKKVVQSLSKLVNGMESSDSETDYETMINEYNESLDIIDNVSSNVQNSKKDYYQFTYVEQ
uniref:Rho-GAP domain-containing protein n=1 Tax=Parastrongyloides trichosuri TaxID=131310 RepID=A0A0N4ZV95_PARTI